MLRQFRSVLLLLLFFFNRDIFEKQRKYLMLSLQLFLPTCNCKNLALSGAQVNFDKPWIRQGNGTFAVIASG